MAGEDAVFKIFPRKIRELLEQAERIPARFRSCACGQEGRFL